MAVLNSKFDILRGWPDGSAVAEDFVKDNANAQVSDGVYRHGNFVRLGFAGDGQTPAAYGAGGTRQHNAAVAGARLGLVIEGDEETSSKMSNTVTCLVGGGYMVRLHLEGQFSENAYGSASIPGGRDQFVLTRPRLNGNDGDGLAAVAADNTRFRNTQDATLVMEAGCPVTVIDGVACRADLDDAAELVIGTCMKVDGDIAEILVH
jgi:hypothetical protein